MAENKANVLNLGSSPTSTVLKLAWPTIIEQLVTSVLTIADTAMVGALGHCASAAVGLIIPVTWLLNGISTAISTGFSIVSAQAIGSDDMDKASRSANKGIFISFIAGLVISLFCFGISGMIPAWMGAQEDIIPLTTAYFSIYSLSFLFNIGSATCSSLLRCSGSTHTPLAVNSLAIITNLILNYFLIFDTREVTFMGTTFLLRRAGLGVAGAALGTLGSLVVSFLLLFIALLNNNRGLDISFSKMPGRDREVYKQASSVGLPVFFERVTISLGQIAYMRIISTMGTTLVATHHLASQAESLSYLPCYGFGVAATTLVSQAVGGRKIEEAEKFGHIASKAGMIYGLMAGAVLFLCGKPIMSVFTSEPEVINFGANLLKIVALGQPAQAAAIIYSGALRGTGESKVPFYIGLSGIWGIRIVICVITTFLLGYKLYAAWWVMLADMCYRGIVTTWFFVYKFKILRGGF